MQNSDIKARKAIVKSIRFYVLKDIASCLRDFQRYLSPHVRMVKPVVHISLNPHPNDIPIMKFTAVHENPLTFD